MAGGRRDGLRRCTGLYLGLSLLSLGICKRLAFWLWVCIWRYRQTGLMSWRVPPAAHRQKEVTNHTRFATAGFRQIDNTTYFSYISLHCPCGCICTYPSTLSLKIRRLTRPVTSPFHLQRLAFCDQDRDGSAALPVDDRRASHKRCVYHAAVRICSVAAPLCRYTAAIDTCRYHSTQNKG